MISSRLIKSNNTAAGCVDIVDAYDPFGDSSGLALYQLNGNATDESGVNNGFSVTGITWGSPGVFGTSASFPGGTSAKIGFPDIINSHSTTISAWVKGSGYWCTPQKEIYAPLGTSDLYWGASGTSTTLTGVEDGSWHHIAVCATSARTVDYYVDGVQVAHNVSATDFPQNYNYSDNWIGHFYHPSTPMSFNGLIDQFRIFNRGLTPLEVEALYIEESCLCGGTVDTLDILDDSSCIALYPLDGNANDLSGNYSGRSYNNLSYGVGEFDLSGNFQGEQYIKNFSGYGIPINNNQVKAVSVWFKLDGNLSGKNTVWSSGKPNNGDAYGILQIINGYLSADHWGGYTIPANTYAITPNTWYNIVYSGSNAYLNGVYWFSYGKALGVDSDTYGFYIGANGSYDYGYITQAIYGAPFWGQIDQVRIFNKALNATEVTILYNETACTIPSEPPFTGGDFNGLDYQLVTNTTTGRTWLDRNLGATRVAISQNDSLSWGWFYQWGRLTDGHQIKTSSTISTISSTDNPHSDKFITTSVSPDDWRSPQNSGLWQGVNGINNPCPAGFRLPTEAELEEEALSWGSQNSAGAFASNLKISTGGGIRDKNGSLVDPNTGYLWTSTISGTDARYYYYASGGDFFGSYRRAAGCPVRPIKDE